MSGFGGGQALYVCVSLQAPKYLGGHARLCRSCELLLDRKDGGVLESQSEDRREPGILVGGLANQLPPV